MNSDKAVGWFLGVWFVVTGTVALASLPLVFRAYGDRPQSRPVIENHYYDRSVTNNECSSWQLWCSASSGDR